MKRRQRRKNRIVKKLMIGVIGEKVLLKFAAGIRREMTVEKFIKYLKIDEETKMNKK